MIKADFTKTRREGRSESDPGNQLCEILYKVEAELFLNQIARGFEGPCFTIHDAILTTEPYVEAIRERILNVTYEIFGKLPTVKVKRLEKEKKKEF